MRTSTLPLAVALLVLGGGAPLTYRFAVVKSTVIITHATAQRRATVGDIGHPGDEVRTGWFGRALIETPAQAARFEILPATRVQLGGPEPGVLLLVERGRLKAFFDALSGTDERIVATPGALLGVRGTRYAVEVQADGAATLAVFEGAVEVRPTNPAFPTTRVGAGEVCRYGPRETPQRHPLPPGLTEERWRGGIDVRAGEGSPRSLHAASGSGPKSPTASPPRGKRGGGGG